MEPRSSWPCSPNNHVWALSWSSYINFASSHFISVRPSLMYGLRKEVMIWHYDWPSYEEHLTESGQQFLYTYLSLLIHLLQHEPIHFNELSLFGGRLQRLQNLLPFALWLWKNFDCIFRMIKWDYRLLCYSFRNTFVIKKHCNFVAIL
jgi:hypothetical protein